jgi:hypothetical protein
MFKRILEKSYTVFLFSVILPFISGCWGGGGGSGSGTASAGIVFNPGTPSPDDITTILPPLKDVINGTLPFTGETLAKIHNPEPTTLLLLGSGILMLGYFSKKK